MFRILIAEDHEVARQGIRALLEGHPGWEVCAEAKDGREAVELANSARPDLILLDIGMPNLNGLEAARQILASSPDIPVLISDHAGLRSGRARGASCWSAGLSIEVGRRAGLGRRRRGLTTTQNILYHESQSDGVGRIS